MIRCLLAAITVYATTIIAPMAASAALQARASQADLVVVFKADRVMELYRAGELLNSYHVSLGWSPAGAKHAQGDGRTPEGLYTITRHNASSRYHLSLAISYPGPEDIGNAVLLGVPAGGQIMIHGWPNHVHEAGQGDPGDWTDGCIAVDNHEIEQIYAEVPDGTPIMIVP